MSKKLQLTGAETFSGPLTYGQTLKKNTIIKVSDADAVKLLTVINFGTPAFTTYVGGLDPSFDFTDDANDMEFNDGSVVLLPAAVANIQPRVPRGTTLRQGDGLPYGVSDGQGGYFPIPVVDARGKVSGMPLGLASGNTMVMLGGSAIAQNTNPLGRGQDIGWVTWLNILAEGRFVILANAGVALAGSVSMKDRVDGEVIALNPAFVVVGAPTEDITNSMLTETIIANMEEVYRKLRNAGIYVFAANLPPHTANSAVALKREAMSAFNAWHSRYCQTNSGITGIDTFSPLADPNTAFNPPLAGMLSDGVVPGVKGAQYIAEANLARVVKVSKSAVFLRDANDIYSATNPYGSLIANHVLYGTSGNNIDIKSGGTAPNFAGTAPPNNWAVAVGGNVTAAVTITGSRPARSDFPTMTWWQTVNEFASNPNASTVQHYSAAANLPAGVVVGDKIDFALEVELSAVANVGAFRMILQFRDGVNAETGAAGLDYAQSFSTAVRGFAGVISAKGIPIPAGTVGYRVMVEGRSIGSTVGAYTLRIGGVDCRKSRTL